MPELAQSQRLSASSRRLPRVTSKDTPLGPRGALVHVGLAAGVGLLASLLAATRSSATLAVLAGWDAGGLTLLALSWLTIATSTAAATRHRARSEDPGRTAVYIIILLTSAASVVASVALVRGQSVARHEQTLLAFACVTCVVVSWILTHTAFTLRYAHLYYRDDEDGEGGLDFPHDDKPDYFDFAYFAFTIGMCFQVSDTAVSTKRLRRAVLLHATMSFAYNTAILAFVLNVLVGLSS